MSIDDPMRLLDKGCAAYVERERRWRMSNRRGRWMVIKPSPARLFKDLSPSTRELIDVIGIKQSRRFSSLSRARAFAREVGGEVRRWHRDLSVHFRGRKFTAPWRLETNPWKRVLNPAQVLF